MDGTNDSIKVLVKSPNQSVKDFAVDCYSDWTIANLKQFLSTNYPSNPPASSQRLIHAGKMLHDNMIVRDIFKQRETAGESVTVHLVCVQTTTNTIGASVKTTTSTDGEHRHSVSSATPVVERNVAGHATPSHTPSSFTPPSYTPPSNTHQYRRSMSVDSASLQAAAATMPPHPFGRQHSLATPPMYNPPNIGQATPPYMHPMYAAYMQHWYQQQQQQLRHRGGSSTLREVPADHPQVIHEEAPPVAPEAAAMARGQDNEQFQDNMAVNAGPGMADIGQNDLRRDWVDSFYRLFSFILLMTLVYFSASMSKFLAFAIIIVLLLIYQAGWFSVRRNRQAPRNAAPDNEAHVRGQEDRPGNQPDAAQDDRHDNNNEQADRGQPAEQTPSVLGTVLMFVTSFFTSLVPQRPPELAGN